MDLKTGAFASRPSYLEIDLDAYSKNIENFKQHFATNSKKPVKICVMVKANAYGHGMVEIARKAEKSGVDFLGVAFLEEGVVFFFSKNFALAGSVELFFCCAHLYQT